MASPSSQQQQQGRVEQIVGEFFAKSLHIILESRIPDIHARSQHPADSSSWSGASSRSGTNTWFNLMLDTCAVAAEAAEPWRQSGFSMGLPMVVDVHVHQGRNSSNSGSLEGPRDRDTLLERWIVKYERADSRKRGPELGGKEEAWGGSGRSGSSSAYSRSGARGGGQGLGNPMAPLVYKRTVSMLRALYCTVRNLPAYRLFRIAKNSSLSRSFTLAFRVSGAAPDLTDLDEAAMTPHKFSPIETSDGRLSLSVVYRPTAASEVTPSIVPRIISDYVGSPLTELRRLSSSPHVGSLPSGGAGKRRGVVPAVSLPSSPSGPNLDRRHSWSGGVNRAPGSSLPSPTVRKGSASPSPVHPSDFSPSPPHPQSPRPVSSPLGHGTPPRSSPSHPMHGRQYPSQPSSLHQTSQPIPVIQRQRSPRITPSPSPSPPNPSVPQDHRYCSAPVSIPRPSARSPRVLPPALEAHTRNSLPPQSPKSREPLTRALSLNSRPYSDNVPNLHSPSEGKIAARLFITSLGGQDSLTFSKPAVKSGRQGELEDDDEELCPFAVDDDDAEGYGSRLNSPVAKEKAAPAFEHSVGWYQRSPEAAAGALLKRLQAAPPLRPSTYAHGFPSETPYGKFGAGGFAKASGRADFWGDSSSGPNLGWGALSGDFRMDGASVRGPMVPSSIVASQDPRDQSGSRILKTAADALEELKGYKEMKEHLLRQSGGTLATTLSALQL